MTDTLIDDVIDQFHVFARSTFDMPDTVVETILFNNVYICYAIIPSMMRDCLMMEFQVYTDRVEEGIVRSIITIPVRKSNSLNENNIQSLLIIRLLIRRCRILLSKLMFKNVDVINNDRFNEGDDDYYRYIIAVKDNGVYKPIYLYLIPCIAYLINNDQYLKQYFDLETNYTIDNDRVNVSMLINQINVSKEELNQLIDSYHVNIFEELTI